MEPITWIILVGGFFLLIVPILIGRRRHKP